MKLTINLDALREVLHLQGWHHLAGRLDKPELRNEKFQGEWNDLSILEYLELHCGEEDAKDILDKVKEMQ